MKTLFRCLVWLALFSGSPPCRAQQPVSYEALLAGAEARMDDPAQAAAARTDEAQTAIAGALFYRKTGEQSHALALLLRGRRFAPDNPELVCDLAILEDQMKLYVDASEVIESLLRTSPSNPKALYTKARIEFDLRHLSAAEGSMRAYLKMVPGDASAHFGLGLMLHSDLKNDDAQHEFEASLALQPRQVESLYELGNLATERGDTAAADKFYQDALTLNSRHAGALTGLGKGEWKRRHDEAAERLFRAAEESSPNFREAHYYRGLVLARMGRQAESAAELASAAQLQQKEDRVLGYRIVPPPESAP